MTVFHFFFAVLDIDSEYLSTFDDIDNKPRPDSAER